MRDEYPPFSWEPGQQPVTFEFDYPDQLNRWLPLVKWLLAFPHYVALVFLGIAAIRGLGDRVLRNLVHPASPARHFRLPGRCSALGEPRQRLRLLHARRVSSVQLEVEDRRTT